VPGSMAVLYVVACVLEAAGLALVAVDLCANRDRARGGSACPVRASCAPVASGFQRQ
jgi:hypothetical protein